MWQYGCNPSIILTNWANVSIPQIWVSPSFIISMHYPRTGFDFKIQFQKQEKTKQMCGCELQKGSSFDFDWPYLLCYSQQEFSMTEKMMLDCKPTYNQSIFNGPRLSPLWDGADHPCGTITYMHWSGPPLEDFNQLWSPSSSNLIVSPLDSKAFSIKSILNDFYRASAKPIPYQILSFIISHNNIVDRKWKI